MERGTLIKIGKKEHITALYDEGLLYMNTLPHFWAIEDGEVRGDPHDGISELQRGEVAKISGKNGKELPMRVTGWTLRIHPPDPEKTNLFCMLALRPSTYPISDRALEFGETALVLMRPQTFMDRIREAMNRERLSGRADLVEYVANEFTGPIGPFRKLDRFAWQAEWRLVIGDGSVGPRQLRIGNLHDVAIVVPTNELNTTIAPLLFGQNGTSDHSGSSNSGHAGGSGPSL